MSPPIGVRNDRPPLSVQQPAVLKRGLQRGGIVRLFATPRSGAAPFVATARCQPVEGERPLSGGEIESSNFRFWPKFGPMSDRRPPVSSEFPELTRTRRWACSKGVSQKG